MSQFNQYQIIEKARFPSTLQQQQQNGEMRGEFLLHKPRPLLHSQTNRPDTSISRKSYSEENCMVVLHPLCLC